MKRSRFIDSRLKKWLGAALISSALVFASSYGFAQDDQGGDAQGSRASVLYPGAQYTASHVYTTLDRIDALAASLQATLGGFIVNSTDNYRITPTPSSAKAVLLSTPAGTFGMFAFHAPMPYAFGEDRIGYYVKDIDSAVRKALRSGASVVVSKFSDPIGSDAIVRWPGGSVTQFYKTDMPSMSPPLQNVPEQRVYVSADSADAYIRGYLNFTDGRVAKVFPFADGADIGQPGNRYRRVHLTSAVGKVVVLITDGHLPYPFGKEHDGFEVGNVASALQNAVASGATVLSEPQYANGRTTAIVKFPGEFIAELHDRDF